MAIRPSNAWHLRPGLFLLREVSLRLRGSPQGQSHHGSIDASDRGETVHVLVRPPAEGDPPACRDMVEERGTHRADPTVAVLATGTAWIDEGRCDHAGYARSDDQRLCVQHQAEAGPAGNREEDRDSRAGTPKTSSSSRHLGGATWTPSIRRPPTPKKAQLAFGTGQHAGICAPPGAAPSLNS